MGIVEGKLFIGEGIELIGEGTVLRLYEEEDEMEGNSNLVSEIQQQARWTGQSGPGEGEVDKGEIKLSKLTRKKKRVETRMEKEEEGGGPSKRFQGDWRSCDHPAVEERRTPGQNVSPNIHNTLDPREGKGN